MPAHHVHGRLVGQAHSLDEAGADSHLAQHLVDLGSPAVHHHRVEPDELQEGHVTGEVLLELLVDHGVAAVLDDDRHPLELADVGKGLDENVGNVRGHENLEF